MNDKELYKEAKKRVRIKRGFKIHLIVFISVSILLFLISFMNRQNWWIYPTLGWGIGVIIHGVSINSILCSKNEIEKEMEALKKNRNQ